MSDAMKFFYQILPYLPFIVLALAVIVATWHINVYW